MTLVAGESAGDDRERPPQQPPQVARVPAERLPHEGGNTSTSEHQGQERCDRQPPADPDVERCVRHAQEPRHRRRLSLAADQQPLAGREQEERQEIDGCMQTARRTRIALELHVQRRLSSWDPNWLATALRCHCPILTPIQSRSR